MSGYTAHLLEDPHGHPTFVVRLDEGHIPDLILLEGSLWEVSDASDDEEEGVINYYLRDEANEDIHEPLAKDVRMWSEE